MKTKIRSFYFNHRLASLARPNDEIGTLMHRCLVGVEMDMTFLREGGLAVHNCEGVIHETVMGALERYQHKS